jgi:hypothetical protein
MFIFVIPIFIFICWKWGDWKNWRKYYPTILYIILIDFLNNFLTANYPLWEYDRVLNHHTFNDILVAFTIYPCTVLIYLPYYPKKILKQAGYIAFWILIYTSIEIAANEIGTFSYHNGWNIWWTIGFNISMFIMLKLHYEKPLLIWPVSLVLMTMTYYIFKLPINTIR